MYFRIVAQAAVPFGFSLYPQTLFLFDYPLTRPCFKASTIMTGAFTAQHYNWL